MQLDSRDLVAILAYTMLTGVLALVVPLAAQALVNTVAIGIFLQPLIVLAVAVLVLLVFRGALRLMKIYLVEILQQRVFMRVSLGLAHHLPRVRQEAIANAYAPELANRFFDVLTIQKSWAKLLVVGPAALLQSLTGLTMMAFYSPLLLAFALALILGSMFVLFGLGLGGVRSSIQESAEKYKVAHWLGEVGRCERNLKFTAEKNFTVTSADTLVGGYLNARNAHFRVLIRQAAGSYLLQALASAGILAVGGWLVIKRELTMGQLVASELIVISVIAAMEKLVSLAEPFYDLLTGLEKIGQVTDLPREVSGDSAVPSDPDTFRVQANDIDFTYPETERSVLKDITLDIKKGSKLGITGPSGSGKTTLLHILTGLYPPTGGTMRLGNRSLVEYDLEKIRSAISMVGDRFDIFYGTLESNLRVGRTEITEGEFSEVLRLTGLDEDLKRMPQGLHTPVLSEGKNLSSGLIQRILIARALLGRPQFLALDEALRGVDPGRRNLLVNSLLSNKETTIVFVSRDWQVLQHLDNVLCLQVGRIAESSPVKDVPPESMTRKFLNGTLEMEA